MQRTLQYEKTASRTYRHFSMPPVAAVSTNKKLEFFYIGRKSGVIDSLIKSFDSGYAAENAEQARNMIKNLLARTSSVPDVIIAEASLPQSSLSEFSAFLSSHNKLNTVPFFIEGSGLKDTEIAQYAQQAGADDVILLSELTKEKLYAKVNFWKRIKDNAIKAQNPEEKQMDAVQPVVSDFTKRIFDIVISAVLMVLFSPLFLLIIIALKIESKGPVFYISKRAGRGYRIFNFYKFRTMEVEANDKITDVSHLNMYNPLQPDGPVFIKIDNDPRVTRLGAFLRKCSLDELPQLLNVFKGDMSLVGNRPLPLYEAASLTTDQWAGRFMAPAGMTGLWQIRRKTKFKMTAEERIKLDINYAEKSNLLYDLWIMAKTPSAVIQGPNA